MARNLRLEYEGAIYHVTARGNERREIYRDDGDCTQFLNCLEECVQRFGVRLYLFCLMPNHFHLLLETPRPNLGVFMQSLLTRYTVYFNRRHRRRGHLTQGRYGAKVVEGDKAGERHLLGLSRYVHLNPAYTRKTKALSLAERIGLVREYRWSSYRGYVNKDARLAWMDYSPVLAQMEGAEERQAENYRRYVETGIAEDDEEIRRALWISARSIGGEKFREWVEEQHKQLNERAGSREDLTFRRIRGRMTVDEVLRNVEKFCGVRREEIVRRQRGTVVRGIASRWLCRYGGLTQRKTGKVLGLSTGAAVSAQLKALSQRLNGDEGLRKRLAKAEKRLDK